MLNKLVKPLGELSRENTQVARGLLILLIVLCHNIYFSNLFNNVFLDIYGFHVFCFLALPFLYPSKKLNFINYRDYFIRYYVPLFFFFIICCFVFRIIYTSNIGPFQWIGKVLGSFIIGSSTLTKQISGFQLFWFLPALFSLLVLKGIYDCIKPYKIFRVIFLILFFLIHLFIGGINVQLKTYLPFGLPIALFSFVLCIAGKEIFEFIKKYNTLLIFIISSTITIFLFVLRNKLHSSINLGDLYLYTIFEPVKFILHDILALAAFIMVLSFSIILAKSKVLISLGKQSLIIYLSHSLLLYSFLFILSRSRLMLSSLSLLLISFSLTILLSYTIALFINKVGFLKDLITPHSWNEWLPVKLINKNEQIP